MAGGGLAPARGGEPPPSSIKAFYKKYKRVTRYNVGDGFLVLAIGNLNNGTGNGGVSYANLNNGLTMKDNWHIKELEKEPIDMMGYVAHRNGKITIRARNFLRGRRLVLTYYREHALTLQQARRLSAYKGFFKHTKITHIKKWKNDMNKIPVAEAFDYAAGVISRYDREVNNGRILRKSTIQRTAGTGQVHAASGREGGCMDQARHTTES